MAGDQQRPASVFSMAETALPCNPPSVRKIGFISQVRTVTDLIPNGELKIAHTSTPKPAMKDGVRITPATRGMLTEALSPSSASRRKWRRVT